MKKQEQLNQFWDKLKLLRAQDIIALSKALDVLVTTPESTKEKPVYKDGSEIIKDIINAYSKENFRSRKQILRAMDKVISDYGATTRTK